MIESPLLPHLAGYIAGQWTDADSGKTFAVTNPATGERLADVPSMDEPETTRAIEAADAALHHPATLDQRRGWLVRIADLLAEHRDELGRIITLEQGKPHPEARAEVDYAAGFYQYCADHIDLLKPHTLDEHPKDHAWTVHHRPAGVVGLITPWNFPIAMMAKKLSAALAGDCAAVLKPAGLTPLTMIAQFTLMHELDMPPGKINLVLGPAKPIGDALCSHRKVAVISFTGSTAVGRTLIKNTADQVKKLALELGGNAPFIVFADADLDAAADHLVKNKFRAAGQTCVCANRVYVQRSAADAFTDKLVQRINKLTPGNGMDEGVDLGPLINRDGFDKVARHVKDAEAKGARRIIGEPPRRPDKDFGCFFPPTVLRGVTDEMQCVHEETFGPLVPIIEFDTDEEVTAAANDTEYGLAAYLFAGDDARAQRIIAALRFGHVGHNSGAGPTPEAPFGGMKQSGFGREGGHEGLFEFVQTQTIPSPT